MVSTHPHETEDHFISGAMADAAAHICPSLRAGLHIGPYVLESFLGRGSFGLVWMAQQESPFQRTVAIKILHDTANSEPILARFKREQRVLATLDHPNIVSIIDAGMTESGNPWYSMAYVNGQPISHNGDWRETVTAFAQVADAVHFAHEQGVLHRDLKPHNILLDSTGRVRIIDFGLSIIQDATGESDGVDSIAGTIGTPAHMAPEQVDGRHVDRRTDVFGVGGSLLHVLTGRAPHDVVDQSLHAALKHVAEHEVQFHRGETDVPNDLRAVVLMATAWSPDHRYATSAALAEDLRRVLSGIRPIAAHPSILQRMWRMFRRRPAIVASISIAATAIVTGLIISLILLANQRAATRESLLSETRTKIAASAIAAASGDLTSAYKYLDTITTENRMWEWSLLHDQINAMQRVVLYGGPDVLSLALDESTQRLAAAAVDTVVVIDIETNTPTRLHTDTEAPVWWSVAWLPDGRLAAGDNSGEFAIFDLNKNTHIRAFFDVSVLGIAPLEDNRVAIASGGDVIIVNSDTLHELDRRTVSDGHIYTLRLIDNRLIAGDSNGDIIAIPVDLQSGLMHRTIHDSTIHRIVPSPKGDVFAVVSRDHTASIVDSTTLVVLTRLIGHRAAVWDATWLSDGTLLTASTDYTLKQWDPDRGLILSTHSSPQQHVWSLARAQDGRIWSGGHDRTIRVWAIDTDHNARATHDSAVIATAWSPNGSSLASMDHQHLQIQTPSSNGTLTIDLTDGRAFDWIDEHRIVVGTGHGDILIFDATSGNQIGDLASGTGSIVDLGVIEQFLVVIDAAHTLRSINIKTGEVFASLETDFLVDTDIELCAITSVTAGPSQNTVITGSECEFTQLRTLPDLQMVRNWRSNVAVTLDMDIRPGTHELLCVGTERPENIRLWNVESGEYIAGFAGHWTKVTGVAWHPTEDRFITIGQDGRVLLWDPRSTTPILEVADLGMTTLTSLAVHPSTAQIVVGTSEGQLLFFPRE